MSHPTLTWEIIRGHYARLLAEQRRLGVTQTSVAAAGHVQQTAISSLLTNTHRGPSVEIFVHAVLGLGTNVSTFFREIELSQAVHAQQQGERVANAAATTAVLARRVVELEQAVRQIQAYVATLPPVSPSSSPSPHSPMSHVSSRRSPDVVAAAPPAPVPTETDHDAAYAAEAHNGFTVLMREADRQAVSTPLGVASPKKQHRPSHRRRAKKGVQSHHRYSEGA